MVGLAEACAAWEKAGFMVLPVPGTKLVRLRRADDAVDLMIIKDRTLVEVVRNVGDSPEQIRTYVNTRFKGKCPPS